MPSRYKVPAYLGNALLLLAGASMFADKLLVLGLLFGALGALNLFLIFKLDQLSRPEAWLAHELEMAKMREELLIAQKRIAELEAPATPKQNGSATQ
jgi:hypothetical protein